MSVCDETDTPELALSSSISAILCKYTTNILTCAIVYYNRPGLRCKGGRGYKRTLASSPQLLGHTRDQARRPSVCATR